MLCDGEQGGRDAVAYLVPYDIGNDKIDQGEANDGKNKIKCLMVIVYQVTFKQMLVEMGKVFKNDGPNPRGETYENA